MAQSYAGYAQDASGKPVGGVLLIASNTLIRTNTTAKALFTIPAGAVIVSWILNVTTAFNSDGTDLVNIGISGTANKFVSALDVSTTGLLSVGVDASQIGSVQSTAQAVTGIYAAGGSAPSTGAMTIICQYYIP